MIEECGKCGKCWGYNDPSACICKKPEGINLNDANDKETIDAFIRANPRQKIRERLTMVLKQLENVPDDQRNDDVLDDIKTCRQMLEDFSDDKNFCA
jgi:hypothetical protein